MNLHYAFWVDYHQPLYEIGTMTEKATEEKNKGIVDRKWENGSQSLPFQEQTLSFRILYPGLLVGTGYNHGSELKDKDAKEIISGISLDYVTGLPYVPGSSVKGVLRSTFIQNEGYVAERLSSSTGKSLSVSEIQELESIIFGKAHPEDSRRPAFDTAAGADVFFDAYPIKTEKSGALLSLENITPHSSDGLGSPTILNLLKILPGVIIQFRFRLTDTVLSDGTTVTAHEKLRLFEALLEDLGVGAKTNVGFGLLEPAAAASGTYLESKKIDVMSQPIHSAKASAEIKVNTILYGRVKTIKDKFAFVELLSAEEKNLGKDAFIHISQISKSRVNVGEIDRFIRIGEIIAVKIIEIQPNGKVTASIKQAL